MKFLKILFFAAAMLCIVTPSKSEADAQPVTRYEYKLLPLGSLTSLQKEGKSAARTREIEGLLNTQGADGWEVTNIFAVRTTFDPNVFFVVLKRPLTEK